MTVYKHLENKQENVFIFTSKNVLSERIQISSDPGMVVTHLRTGSALSTAVTQRSVPFLYLAALTIDSTFVLEFLTAHFRPVVCH